MKRLFEDKEFDKISKELLNKIYPMDALNSFYSFGVAQAFSTMTDIANRYINSGYGEQMDAWDVKKLVQETLNQNKEVKDFYERLRKDGIEV